MPTYRRRLWLVALVMLLTLVGGIARAGSSSVGATSAVRLNARAAEWVDGGRVISYWDQQWVWTIKADGTQRRKVAEDDVLGASGASVSPDGRMVATAPRDLDRPDALVFRRLDGRTVKRFRVKTGRVEYFDRPVWARDATAVALEFMDVSRERLLVAGLRTGVRSVSRNPTRDDRSPDWSPRGDRIAFWSCSGGCALALMRPDGSRRTDLLMTGEFFVTGPRWAPDGRAIAIAFPFGRSYPALDEFSESRRRYGIYRIRLDGSKLRRVGATAPIDDLRHEVHLAWSRDSRWLAVSDSGGISVVSANGRTQRRLTTIGKSSTVSWRPSSRILFVHRGSLFTLLPGERPVRLQPR